MSDAAPLSTGATAPHPGDYFAQTPQWSTDGNTKRFEVMADAISGRIPVTRLESWRDFNSLLESTSSIGPAYSWCFAGIDASTGA